MLSLVTSELISERGLQSSVQVAPWSHLSLAGRRPELPQVNVSVTGPVSH